MRNLSLPATAMLVASLALSSAAAQEAQRPVDIGGALRGAHGITAADGQLLAIGGGIEAAFEPGQVVITPLLGSAAPHNMPLTLRLDSVLRGDRATAEIAPGRRPTRRGNQVEYAHDLGVLERYTSRPDGVKQSVLIEQPLGGSGDLVVRYAITTELDCAHADEARQLEFSAGDLGGVHVGSVLGIDARGARVEGHLRYDGEHLDLVLPGAFVDEAAYPIDVDPLLGGQIGTGRSFSDNEMDIAYDLTNDVYGVVYQGEASATDRDLYMQLISGAGARQGGPILITSNAHRSELAKVANCNQLDQFLVVWQDNGTGDFDVLCCTVDPLTGARSSIVPVASTTGVDETNPDIGGDSTPAGVTPQGICVWDEGTNIRSAVLQIQSGTPVVTNVGVVANGQDVDYPVITKDGGAARRHFIAFRAPNNTVVAVAIDATGTLVGAPLLLAVNNAAPYGRLDIDGNGEHFTVVMEELEPGSTTDHDIRAVHGNWNAGSLNFVDGSIIEGDRGFDESRPCIALMSSKYAAAWIDVNANASDIEATNLPLDSASLRCGNEVTVGGTSRFVLVNPAIVSRLSGGDTGSDVGLLSNRLNDTSNGNAVLHSRIYTVFGNGSIRVLPGTGACSNGAQTGINGPCAVGNQNFAITLTGADPGATLAFLGVDIQLRTPVPVCGAGCGGVVLPDASARLVPVAGAAELGLPIPCDPALSGARLYAQWLILGTPQAGSCTLAPGLRPSDAVELTIGD